MAMHQIASVSPRMSRPLPDWIEETCKVALWVALQGDSVPAFASIGGNVGLKHDLQGCPFCGCCAIGNGGRLKDAPLQALFQNGWMSRCDPACACRPMFRDGGPRNPGRSKAPSFGNGKGRAMVRTGLRCRGMIGLSLSWRPRNGCMALPPDDAKHSGETRSRLHLDKIKILFYKGIMNCTCMRFSIPSLAED